MLIFDFYIIFDKDYTQTIKLKFDSDSTVIIKMKPKGDIMKTLLKENAQELNITLSDDKIEKLFLYQKVLLEWNQKMNLTNITEEREVIIKHLIDSMTIEKYLPQNASLIDVGTGAGFPGMVLKIVREDIKVTLLDSLNKRIHFLDEVIKECQLENVITVHGRAEDIAKEDKYREKYDIATARAVANLSTLSEYCLPFVKVGGSFIAMKGNATDEIENAKNAIQILGGEIEKIDHFYLPNTEMERNVLVIKKIRNTSNLYPRKAGTPSNKPL